MAGRGGDLVFAPIAMTADPPVCLAQPEDGQDIASMSRRLIERGLPWNWRPARVPRPINAGALAVLCCAASKHQAGSQELGEFASEAGVTVFGASVLQRVGYHEIAVRQGRYSDGVDGVQLEKWLPPAPRQRSRDIARQRPPSAGPGTHGAGDCYFNASEHRAAQRRPLLWREGRTVLSQSKGARASGLPVHATPEGAHTAQRTDFAKSNAASSMRRRCGCTAAAFTGSYANGNCSCM